MITWVNIPVQILLYFTYQWISNHCLLIGSKDKRMFEVQINDNWMNEKTNVYFKCQWVNNHCPMIVPNEVPIPFLASYRILEPLKGTKSFGTVRRGGLTVSGLWCPPRLSKAVHGKKKWWWAVFLMMSYNTLSQRIFTNTSASKHGDKLLLNAHYLLSFPR